MNHFLDFSMRGDYMIVCYFFPMRGDINDFQIGDYCSACPDLRPTCSAFFKGLCGIDRKDEISGSERNVVSIFLVLILFL